MGLQRARHDLATKQQQDIFSEKNLHISGPIQFKLCRSRPTSRSSNIILALVAQMVKRLPPMRETRVWFLGQEDPLEKEMAIHSSTLAWKIPWTEEPNRLQSTGSQRVGHDWATFFHFPSFDHSDISPLSFHNSTHPALLLFFPETGTSSWPHPPNRYPKLFSYGTQTFF